MDTLVKPVAAAVSRLSPSAQYCAVVIAITSLCESLMQYLLSKRIRFRLLSFWSVTDQSINSNLDESYTLPYTIDWLYNVQCAHCTLYSLQCTVYSLHCTLDTEQYTVYNTLYIVNSVYAIHIRLWCTM